MKFISSWFKMGSKEAAARKRLGDKINYLKQYQHSFEFEKMKKREIKTMNEVRQLKSQIHSMMRTFNEMKIDNQDKLKN